MRDDSGVQIEFRTADPARPPASELLAAMVADMNELYGKINEAIDAVFGSRRYEA